MSFFDRRVTADFAESMNAVGKILAVEIAGLGDLIHSLPSLWALRQAHPRAQLHCLVQENNASLLRLTPWIDRVVAYRRGGAGTVDHHLHIARLLRSERYDLAVDFMGAEYSSVVAGLSGAATRLLRRPGPLKRRYAWRLCATHVMQSPFYEGAMYQQRLGCLRDAGYALPRSTFQIVDESAAGSARSIGGADYIHVSPCNKLAHRELPPPQLARLLARLAAEYPRCRLVLSCSAKPRERAVMAELLALLPFEPWRVFEGSLDIPQLYALIRTARLHLSGNTGTMHLAWLAGTPSVSWLPLCRSAQQWVPDGEQHRVVGTTQQAEDCLRGIDDWQLLAQARQLLDAFSPAAEPIAAAAAMASHGG